MDVGVVLKSDRSSKADEDKLGAGESETAAMAAPPQGWRVREYVYPGDDRGMVASQCGCGAGVVVDGGMRSHRGCRVRRAKRRPGPDRPQVCVCFIDGRCADGYVGDGLSVRW